MTFTHSTYHYMPNDLVSFNGSSYVVDGIGFDSQDAAWEYAAEWGYLSEPAMLQPQESGDHFPDYAA